MILAVASKGLDVSSYFEGCTNYNCFTVEHGEITEYRNLPILSGQNGSAAEMLRDLGVDTIIVGCISNASRSSLELQGLSVFSGAIGSAKQSVEAFITDTFIASDESCDEYYEV